MHILRYAIDYVGRIEFNVARTFFVGVVLGCLTVNPAAADPGVGTLFGLSGNSGQLLAIDPVTGVPTVISGGLVVGLGFGAPALARQPVTGTLYAGRGGGIPNIYTVNAATGVATFVGNSGLGFAAISSLDFRSDGVLFAAVNIAGDGGTGADHLATIDPVTGLATVIGPFGTCSVPPPLPADGSGSCTIEGMEGIAFDSDGMLWGVHSQRGAAGDIGFYSINPANGAATFVGQLVDAMGFPASGGFVSLQFGCDGTTYLGSARALGTASDGGFLATMIGPGDLASLTFTFAGTPSTAGSSLSALAFEGDCSPVVPGDDVLILPPDPDVPLTASVQEVIKPGTIKVTSGCVLLRGLPNTNLDLVQAIKASTTDGCINLATELAKLGPPEPAAVLRKQHRGFPAGGPAGGPEVFEVALVVSRNTEGDTDQLTKGVVVQEATPKGVLDQSCDTSSSDVSQSPFTAGINLSGKEASGVMARTLTGACNRARDFSHFSNQLLAYPLRVDPIEPTTLQAQVHQEAADARTTIVLNEDFGCVDRPFLRNLKRQLNKAMREVNKGNFLKGMCAMQEATLFSLAPDPDDPDDPDFDPYGSCPDGNPLGPDDPAGEIPSRFLTLAYQIHRLLLEPGPGAFVKYENDPRVLCELSTLPGDVPLDCSDPGPLPACVGL